MLINKDVSVGTNSVYGINALYADSEGSKELLALTFFDRSKVLSKSVVGFISEGYEVSALHYLMKPAREEKLSEVLDRAVSKLGKDEKALMLESGGETNLVPVYRIRFIDVRGNYTTVHADKEYTIKKTLSDVEKELDERFYRVGRSCIVNLTQISKVTKTDIFFNSGETVPLPRGSYEKVNRAIIEFN